MSCEHRDFHISGVVHHISYEPDGETAGYRAEVRILCTECGKPFEWVGLPKGILNDGPTVSAMGIELRGPIRPLGDTTPLPKSEIHVSYTQALKLRGLGYNKPCNTWYALPDKELIQSKGGHTTNSDDANLAAPSVNEMIEWFYTFKADKTMLDNRGKIIALMGEVIADIYEDELNSYNIIRDANQQSGMGMPDKRPLLKKMEEMIDTVNEFKRLNKI